MLRSGLISGKLRSVKSFRRTGEFVPGLTYVAVSRVKKTDDLQVLNFDRKQLLKPPKQVIEICSSGHVCEPVADLSCCRYKELSLKTTTLKFQTKRE